MILKNVYKLVVKTLKMKKSDKNMRALQFTKTLEKYI